MTSRRCHAVVSQQRHNTKGDNGKIWKREALLFLQYKEADKLEGEQVNFSIYLHSDYKQGQIYCTSIYFYHILIFHFLP